MIIDVVNLVIPVSCLVLQGFLQDLFLQHRKSVTLEKLDDYTDTMVTSRVVVDHLIGPSPNDKYILTNFPSVDEDV